MIKLDNKHLFFISNVITRKIKRKYKTKNTFYLYHVIKRS